MDPWTQYNMTQAEWLEHEHDYAEWCHQQELEQQEQRLANVFSAIKNFSKFEIKSSKDTHAKAAE